MDERIIRIIGFFFFFQLNGCSEPVQSVDLTAEWVFTKGIEGPATDTKGKVYAVNYQEEGTIGVVSPDGEHALFVRLPAGSIGNGIRFGQEGQMFVADYTAHHVLEVNMNTKDIHIFAHEPEANQPNDLAISPNGTLYASDPNWADSTGNLWKVTRDQGFELLESDMGTTNGIEVSPDGKRLYVNESVQRRIWMYDILENGEVSHKKEFASFEDFGLDGMRCDQYGNLYVCRYGKGTIAIFSPDGALIREINLKGETPSNITFGPDYQHIYITLADRGCIETLNVAGLDL